MVPTSSTSTTSRATRACPDAAAMIADYIDQYAQGKIELKSPGPPASKAEVAAD
jgi:hypothetical protein